MLTSLALIFSYVEVLIPFNIGIPGIKLGIANLVVLVALYLWSGRSALLVNLARILLAGLLFGTGMTLAYSLCGGLLSLAAMAAAKRWGGLGLVGVSVLGGVFHNVGQLAVAVLLLGNLRISYYLPVLLIAGMITGVVIGLVSQRILALLDRIGPLSGRK